MTDRYLDFANSPSGSGCSPRSVCRNRRRSGAGSRSRPSSRAPSSWADRPTGRWASRSGAPWRRGARRCSPRRRGRPRPAAPTRSCSMRAASWPPRGCACCSTSSNPACARWPPAGACWCWGARPRPRSLLQPPSPSAPSKGRCARWARSCAAARRPISCTWLPVPKRRWAARCASSSRRARPTSRARSCGWACPRTACRGPPGRPMRLGLWPAARRSSPVRPAGSELPSPASCIGKVHSSSAWTCRPPRWTCSACATTSTGVRCRWTSPPPTQRSASPSAPGAAST